MYKLYVLVTDDGIDHTTELESVWKEHKIYLKLYFDKVKTFVISANDPRPMWEAFDDMETVYSNHKPFGRKNMRRLEETYGITVELK